MSLRLDINFKYLVSSEKKYERDKDTHCGKSLMNSHLLEYVHTYIHNDTRGYLLFPLAIVYSMVCYGRLETKILN